MKQTVGEMEVGRVPHAGNGDLACSAPASTRPLHDPLRRFTPTPHTADLPVMGRAVRLETNSSTILQHMAELFARYPAASNRDPDFLWRIIVESDVQSCPPWPKRSAFSDDRLRFAEFGQRNFVAVDLDVREGIAFVSQGLVEDAPGFTSPFIDTLFYMTAGSLGLVSFSAACVARGPNGLLVLGRPNQGKTTACYLSAKDGLEFCADQTVFLARGNPGLQAWGDFVPVAFRPQSLVHLPELEALTRSFSYCDFNFYYLCRRKPPFAQKNIVAPVCCIVLERESSSTPRLTHIAEADRLGLLSENLAFKEDDQFAEQQKRVLEALAWLPAYRLAYGSDPAEAVPFFRRLLTVHDGGALASHREGAEISSRQRLVP